MTGEFQILSFPNPVVTKTQEVVVSVVPTIYEYDNGTYVTVYSNHTQSANGHPTVAPPATPILWTTLGTVLTYPTTYLAVVYLDIGVSSSQKGDASGCKTTSTTISIQSAEYPKLIVPSSTPADFDKFAAAATKYLDAKPTLSAAVSPFKPSMCTHTFNALPFATLTNAQAVTLTTAKFLVTTGKAVITRVPALAQSPGKESPPAPSSQNQPSTKKSVSEQGNTPASDRGTTPVSNQGTTPVSGQGTTTTPVSNTTPVQSTPILVVGDTTITAGSQSEFVVGSQTLTNGGSAVIGGTTVVLQSDGSVAVINGQTSTLAATAPASYTGAVATGEAARVKLGGFAAAAVGVLGFWL